MPEDSQIEQGKGTGSGHESADINARNIAIAAGLLVGLLFATHFILNAVLRSFRTHPAGSAVNAPLIPLALGQQFPPPPRLQADPRAELVQLKSAQMGLLHSYGWVDAGHTTAHIPIEEAKILVLQRGLPRVVAQPTQLPSSPEEGANAHVR